ncbi:glycosyltransferase [Lactobacillus amylovorus]|uniref:glycosyltransferase n=1 Tax=Lactobacillus amylovorus TaxID=1604 RepID=UPI0022E521C3|nr:glycosyltransferase [Lactobacillus amylovorus]
MVKVLVLMSSYNGQKFIKDQIQSIMNQKNIDVDILIRDDGSTDATREVLNKLKYKYPQNIKLIFGKNKGYKKSFMSLVYNCDDKYDFYAFSDQDDIWLNNKLYAAINYFEKNGISNNTPSLYYGMMTQVDEKLKVIPEQQNFQAVPNKKMILFQNFVQGSTIVFNQALLKAIQQYRIPCEVAHDVWLPIVARYLGTVIGDKESYILYRRHKNAVTVKMRNNYWKNLMKSIFNGQYVTNFAKYLLAGYKQKLRIEDIEFLNKIKNYKKINNKVSLLLDKQVRKYSLKGTILLKSSILFNRLDD